jgi:peptide/nickel transport system permease protein
MLAQVEMRLHLRGGDEQMTQFVVRRFALALVEVLVIGTLVFMFLHLLPGNPAVTILTAGGASVAPTPAQIAAITKELGLNLPLGIQYLRWLQGILTLQFGHSFYNGLPVTQSVLQRLPISFELLLTAIGLALVTGIPLGIASATRAGRWVDQLNNSLFAVSLSIPVFVVGMMLIWVFGIVLRWYPVGLFVPFLDAPASNIRELSLPAVALAFTLLGTVGRISRGSVLDVLSADYVRTARSKGLAQKAVLYRHVLRNALGPVITVVGMQFGSLIGGTVLVESVFNWPGLSSLLFSAVQARDYPVVQGVVLTTAFLFIAINLLVDVVLAMTDPRIRYGS